MKAEYQARTMDPQQRSDLGRVLPLATPFVVMVDPASHCNYRCRFCATGNRELIAATGRYQGPMALDLFRKIVDDLREFPDPIRVLRFYKEGEPLLNRHLPEMIRYARESGRVGRIDMTTNGSLLSPRLNERLIDAGIDQINISVNGVNDAQFLQYVRTRTRFAKYVENIRHLHSIRGKCEIYVKAIQENLSAEEQQRFLEVFGEIADRIFFEHISPAWPGYAFEEMPMDFTIGHYGQEVLERRVCPYFFYLTVINSDGTVSLCVQDWARKLLIGDVRQESLKEIWHGQRITAHRLAHLEGRRKEDPTCAICQVMSYGVLDNIDAATDDIRERLLAGKTP
ncbi:MAG: radical SAM protein [Magnetococcales bacterium]|nr:radical SAM protein [Magnetococcales bacterium]